MHALIIIFDFRYKPPPSNGPSDDPTPDYMNLLGMIFSMCGLMMKVNKQMFQQCGFRTGPTLTGLYKHREWLET